jgi:hypothetical protein
MLLYRGMLACAVLRMLSHQLMFLFPQNLFGSYLSPNYTFFLNEVLLLPQMKFVYVQRERTMMTEIETEIFGERLFPEIDSIFSTIHYTSLLSIGHSPRNKLSD